MNKTVSSDFSVENGLLLQRQCGLSATPVSGEWAWDQLVLRDQYSPFLVERIPQPLECKDLVVGANVRVVTERRAETRHVTR